MSENTKKSANIGYTIVGIIVIILAILGFVSVCKFTFNTVKNNLNKTSEKKEFAEFIYPLVIIDAPSFDSVTTLTDTTTINAGIWNIILNEDLEKYTLEDNCYVIPSADVDKSIVSLFGSEKKVTHQSVGDYELNFDYNGDNSTYRIPTNLTYFQYYPKIESFTVSGNIYNLNVGYYTPRNYLTENDIEPKSQKNMLYVIEKNGADMKIVSISSAVDAYIGG